MWDEIRVPGPRGRGRQGCLHHEPLAHGEGTDAEGGRGRGQAQLQGGPVAGLLHPGRGHGGRLLHELQVTNQDPASGHVTPVLTSDWLQPPAAGEVGLPGAGGQVLHVAARALGPHQVSGGRPGNAIFTRSLSH